MNALLHKNYNYEKVKSGINLTKCVHITMDHHIKCFDESIARQNIGCEALMYEYGHDLPKEHVKILKLADVGILNYATLASISRANRAVCLRAQEAPIEHLLSACVASRNRFLVKKYIIDMTQSALDSFDPFIQKVAKMMIKEKRYFPEHPLSRFF